MAAPAGSEKALATKQQKANKALTKKRILALPAELQQEYKRKKSAKELHVGFLPGVPETTAKRRPRVHPGVARRVYTSLSAPAHLPPSFPLPFESGNILPLSPGTPAILPAPLPPPWARSAPSTTAGPSRNTSNYSPVAGPSRVNWSPPSRHSTPSPHADTCASPATPSMPFPVPSTAIVESDAEGNGSDLDPAEKPDEQVTFRAPTLATDSLAVLEILDPTLQNAVNQMDRQNDAAIRATLPADRIVFDWRCDLAGFTGVREEFTGTPGPTFPMSEIESPVNVFLKFWDQEIMSLIEKETNSYAADYLDRHDNTPGSRIRRWHPTSVRELFIFFAVMIQQSLFPSTVESEYFYPSSRMTAMPYFKEYMPYNRLLLLKKCLHFANNANMSDSLSLEQRRLYKISPIIGHLNRKFQELYLPGQNVVIDESLLKRKCHGHLSFIQKIATKAAKTGIKSYELCESDTGYLWKFAIYAGKDATTDDRQVQDQTDETQTDDTDRLNETDQQDEMDRLDETDFQPAGATAKIVYDLASPLFEKGYTLIMDNFYNSPLLARSLKLRGTDCYGTLRLNRENVPDRMKSLTKQQLRTGDVVSSTSGDLNVIVWKDSSIVSMVSTYHKVETSVAEKYSRWRFKPQVVLDYNKVMGGVDKKDQMLSNFPIERVRNSIWYKKLFRRLLNISVQNSYIIYKCKDDKISHRNFRLQVAEGLLKMFFQGNTPPTNVVTTRHLPNIIRGQKPRPVLQNNHFPIKITEPPLRRQCVLCSEFNKRSRTMWMCDVCEVALCIECLKPYHTGVLAD